MSDAFIFDRWIITGLITLVSPLRIGTGHSSDSAPDGGGEIHEIGDIAVDHSNAPIIPATALKAHVRRQLAGAGVPPDTLVQLFGRGPEGRAERGAEQSRGGRVEFADATLDLPSGQSLDDVIKNVTQTSINAKTGTPQRHMLRESKVVVPGTTFMVEMIGDRLSQHDVAALLGGLEMLDHGNFGGGDGVGRGLVKWTPGAVKRLDGSATMTWMLSGEANWQKFATLAEIEATELTPLDHAIAVEIELKFEGAFMVGAGATAKVNDQEVLLAIKEFVAGRHALPESSVRGAIRAQAARIMRTLDLAIESDKLDVVTPFEWLFGKTRRRGALSFSLFQRHGSKADDKSMSQEFVALDRLTGGAAEGAKFTLTPAVNPVYRGTITLDLARPGYDHEPAQAAMGLLALLWRDLREGDVAFGYGKTKGFGYATLSAIEQTRGAEVVDLQARARDAVKILRGQMLKPAAVQAQAEGSR